MSEKDSEIARAEWDVVEAALNWFKWHGYLLVDPRYVAEHYEKPLVAATKSLIELRRDDETVDINQVLGAK